MGGVGSKELQIKMIYPFKLASIMILAYATIILLLWMHVDG